MNRREFFRLMGVASVAPTALASIPLVGAEHAFTVDYYKLIFSDGTFFKCDRRDVHLERIEGLGEPLDDEDTVTIAFHYDGFKKVEKVIKLNTKWNE